MFDCCYDDLFMKCFVRFTPDVTALKPLEIYTFLLPAHWTFPRRLWESSKCVLVNVTLPWTTPSSFLLLSHELWPPLESQNMWLMCKNKEGPKGPRFCFRGLYIYSQMCMQRGGGHVLSHYCLWMPFCLVLVCSPAYMTEADLCICSMFYFSLKASWSIMWVSHLMPDDGWCKGDLLVVSEEQAAGGKLFCPCLLRAWLLFFILFTLSQHSSLSCSGLLLPCSALLDLAVKLPSSEQN